MAQIPPPVSFLYLIRKAAIGLRMSVKSALHSYEISDKGWMKLWRSGQGNTPAPGVVSDEVGNEGLLCELSASVKYTASPLEAVAFHLDSKAISHDPQ